MSPSPLIGEAKYLKQRTIGSSHRFDESKHSSTRRRKDSNVSASKYSKQRHREQSYSDSDPGEVAECSKSSPEYSSNDEDDQNDLESSILQSSMSSENPYDRER